MSLSLVQFKARKTITKGIGSFIKFSVVLIARSFLLEEAFGASADFTFDLI